MKEYIDRDAAIHATDGELTVTGEKNMATVAEYITGVVERLKKLPAQPERKKGSWIGAEGLAGIGIFVCDQCAGFALMETDFCPNCGAKMQVTAGRQKK